MQQHQLKAWSLLLRKGRYIPSSPTKQEWNVHDPTTSGACATYKNEFANINSRLDQLDAKVQGAAQSAESANQSAQRANQRLDQIEGRVQQLESAPRRAARG